MIFLLSVPIVGVLCLAASFGILMEISSDRWFPILLYLFVPAVSSLFYTLARFGLLPKSRDLELENDLQLESGASLRMEKLTIKQKVSAVSLSVFFISAVMLIFADLPEMGKAALLYTRSKNLVLEKKDMRLKSEAGETISVSIMLADTPEKQGIGLIAVSALNPNEGMLYIFEKEEIPRFSMRYISLHLEEIVISRDLTVTEIISTEPCSEKKCPVYQGSKPALYSLEVPKGFSAKNRIVPGSRAELPEIQFHK